MRRLVQLLSGCQSVSWFHPDMLALEPRIAEQKHQQRAWSEFLAMWRRVFDACSDLPRRPDEALIEALHLAIWGGRRYAMQLRLDQPRMQQWPWRWSNCAWPGCGRSTEPYSDCSVRMVPVTSSRP